METDDANDSGATLKKSEGFFRFACLFIPALAAGLVATSVCHALTAREVTDKMPEAQRFSYLSGIVDTLSYQTLLEGNRTRAQCISDIFYKDKAGLERLIKMLYAFPDKGPVALFIVALKKECAA